MAKLKNKKKCINLKNIYILRHTNLVMPKKVITWI